MSISNPVNLAPVLAATQSAIVGEVNENQTNIASALAALLTQHGDSQTDIAAALAALLAQHGDSQADIAAALADLIAQHNISQTDIAAISAQIVSPIKSIQRGLFSAVIDAEVTANISISPVDLSKSFLTVSGGARSVSASTAYPLPHVRLTSDTNLAITSVYGLSTLAYRIAWEVIEYV